MNNIVNGYIFHDGDELYHLSPASFSGPIFAKVDVGDVVLCYYNEDECEVVKQTCINRLREWEDNEECDYTYPGDTDILYRMECSPLLNFIENGVVEEMLLEFEAEWLL